MAAAATPKLGYGFPSPGPQHPNGNKVMDHVFFLNESGWKQAREVNKYDIIVVGSGFCGLGLVHRALENNPTSRILMIDRGSFFLPEHFQNLPSATSMTLGGKSETFPWTLDARTASGNDGTVTWQHGMVPFFGGRSTVWSAWCPRPNDDEMDGWSRPLKKACKKHMEAAERLLNVQKADQIDAKHSEAMINEITKQCDRPVYHCLQKAVQTRLDDGRQNDSFRKVGIYRTEAAPLASKSNNGTDFQKFSTPGPLLDLLLQSDRGENFQIATDVTVSRILHQGPRATALETSRGLLPIGNAKLVLAMGTLPPVTLIQNSFPDLPNIGQRFSAHFITSVVARVPRHILDPAQKFGALEVGAYYVAGVPDNDYKKQYHIQLTSLYDEDPVGNYNRAMRYMPDVVSTASLDQLRTSKGYVVFVCAVLGELDHTNKNSTFSPNPSDTEPTTNSLLRVVSKGANDQATWKAMDDATFATLEWLSRNTAAVNGDDGGGDDDGVQHLEYWQDGVGWTQARPSQDQRRVNALVHESSTLHAGEASDPTAPVNAENFQLKGTDNVFITGGGLWPQGGSWNPTLAMTNMAMELADQLVPLQDTAIGLDYTEIVKQLDAADNVYIALKDVASRYLWVNDMFAKLVGAASPEELIGKIDTNNQESDRTVIEQGQPMLNLEETMTVPNEDGSGTKKVVQILTQKGLVRHKTNPQEVIGISVCFSIVE